MDALAPFARMLRELREPLLIASPDGRILAANVAGAEALGTSVDALDGASLGSFAVDPETVGHHLRELGRPFALRARDGRRFNCDARALEPQLLLLRLSGGPDAMQWARQFFETVRQLERVTDSPLRTLAELSRARLVPWMRSVAALTGAVFLLDESNLHLELVAELGIPDDYIERFRLLPMSSFMPLTEAVKRRTTIYLGTPEDHAQFPSFAQAEPRIAANGMLSIPLEVLGRCIGVLGVGFAAGHDASTVERESARVFAGELAVMLERLRRVGNDVIGLELSDRATLQLTRMQAFTSALARAITPVEVTEAIVDMGTVATAARSGRLWLVSPDGATVCLARAVGQLDPGADDHSIPLDRSLRLPVLDTIRDGTPVWIEARGQFAQRYPELAVTDAESSLGCLPLFSHGRCIGALAFAYEGSHTFFEDDRAFLQVLSGYAAQAIDRARLYAAEQRGRRAAEANQRRSDFLADASKLLASSLDYGATLARVAQAAVPRIADWCIVELEEERLQGHPALAVHVDPTKSQYVLELSQRVRALEGDRGIRGVIRSGVSKLSHSVTPEVVARGFPNNPELAKLYARTGLVSSMVVPITAHDHVLGAIVLNSVDPERLYDEEDLAMAEELGRRAGLAVENARLYRTAREADRRKDEFLAMLSHELRNPLAPIVTALDLMELRIGDVCAREREIVSRQVHHLVRLVGDLLNVARVTRGEIQLDKERCEISKVVDKAVEMASSLFDDRAQQLAIDVPATGLAVDGDVERLAQAIANLLTNASKYGERGGVVSLVASTEGPDVVIRVRDTGIGIAAETLPSIFDLFVQEKRALDRSQGGLGIGLTVVKRLVELHDGTVAAHSDGLGKGSEFVIRLPTAAGSPVAKIAVSTNNPRRGLRLDGRALVVDDNLDAAELLCEALDELGYTTRVAHDVDTAMVAAMEFEPDLALLDIGLPDVDGYELARRLRASRLSATTRLVALTGYGQESDFARSRAAGFDEHIVKPLDLKTLREILERARAGH